MLTVHRFVKPVVLRGPARSLRAYSAQTSAKDQIKEEISSKQTNQQARRQSELGASDQQVGEASPSTGAKSRADETVETGEPFSKGERTADKQTRHGKDDSSHADQHAGGGNRSVGASPSSAETQGSRNRDANAVREENADKAADIAKDSRQQGGYSQFSQLFTSALFHVQSTPDLSTMRSPFLGLASHAFSTSARMMDDKLSTEEANSLKARGQRPDGSSPQSPSTHDQPRSDDNPGKPSGVKPSYKRAKGMPHDPTDEAHPFGSSDKRDSDFESLTSRKQPQKDKSTLRSVKDAFTPDSMKGEAGAAAAAAAFAGGRNGSLKADGMVSECALVEKASKMVNDLMAGAQKLFGSGNDGQKK
ncbi:hypothetical protein OC861_002927 [Tilletia horrida]|nr:hypothetical protein OC861_002927 [Tilletia horrida]